VKWIAVDIVGNTSDVQSARFAIDTDAPETTATLSPAPQNGYYRAPFVSLVADDNIEGGGSGIASTEYKLDGAADWSVYSGPFQVAADGPHTLDFRSTDNAGNVEDTHSIAFTVDSTPPTVALTTPLEGATYTLNQLVKASYLCSDEQSGLLSCVGTVANGAYIATNTPGPKTFTVTGTDLAGNTTTVSRAYNVFWPFDGFEDPLDARPGKYVEEKAGKDIDVIFSLGGDRGMSILAIGSPYSQKVNCSDYTPARGCGKAKRLKRALLARQQGEDFGPLKYDRKKKRYSFEWETDKSWRGTCRMLVVQLTDGSVHSVVVKFK
jgi:Bacterial Ig-like domain